MNKEEIIKKYCKVFKKNGYPNIEAVEIFPSIDTTTLFTGATINAVKNTVLMGDFPKGYIVQPCLRVQNLSHILEEDYNPEYLSSFTMFGSFCPVEDFNLTPLNDFLMNIPTDRKIIVKTSTTLTHSIFKKLSDMYTPVVDEQPQSYYHWLYGDPELSGEGLTFSIEQSEGIFLDIGNLVLVSKNSKAIGWEMGFGIETFYSRFYASGDPFMASDVFSKLPLTTSVFNKQLGDALMIAKVLFENSIQPGSGKAASVMRKAIRSSAFLCHLLRYDRARFKELVEKVSFNAEFIKLLLTSFDETQESLTKFIIQKKHIVKHRKGSYLEKKIKEYQRRYAIPDIFLDL